MRQRDSTTWRIEAASAMPCTNRVEAWPFGDMREVVVFVAKMTRLIHIGKSSLVANSIVTIGSPERFVDYSREDANNFPFYELLNGLLRFEIITAVSLEVALLAILWAETIHLVIPFHRNDRVYRHCVIQANLSVVLIILSVVLKATGNEIIAMLTNTQHFDDETSRVDGCSI
ncbi:hypothetical protein F5B22DRAFT_641770 [Xylaria bambusicola]|uniref:uncharacterized protein n=1 Tax=Xylaria bambusicola TaxID=326684 RepID=UPI002008A726|nr:uncharacterized protein F5B22DRAFT_641770 [Xylaria bambusicola]KAI0526628.1 hypothetical protein F5B22DRAFT_641770 [Xylaria bambusicola]